jgi:hypothetical protein
MFSLICEIASGVLYQICPGCCALFIFFAVGEQTIKKLEVGHFCQFCL